MYNNEQLVALAQQCEQEGGDLDALISTLLEAGGKTSLGLNQWSSTDKPGMADFNRDNEIIDREIRELKANKVNKDGSTVMTGPIKTINAHIRNDDNISNVIFQSADGTEYSRIIN